MLTSLGVWRGLRLRSGGSAGQWSNCAGRGNRGLVWPVAVLRVQALLACSWVPVPFCSTGADVLRPIRPALPPMGEPAPCPSIMQSHDHPPFSTIHLYFNSLADSARVHEFHCGPRCRRTVNILDSQGLIRVD